MNPRLLRSAMLGTSLACVVPSVAAAAPVNTAPPEVPRTVTFGGTATCTPGVWDGAPVSYAYEWFADSTRVGDTPTLRVASGRLTETTRLVCTVTATDAAGETASASSGTVSIRPARSTLRLTRVRTLPRGVVEVAGVVGPASALPGARRGTVRLYRQGNVLPIGAPARVDARGRFTARGTERAGRLRLVVEFVPTSSVWTRVRVTRVVTVRPGRSPSLPGIGIGSG